MSSVSHATRSRGQVLEKLVLPTDIEQKARITVRLLKKRLGEYAVLEQEIARFREEVKELGDSENA